MKLLQTLKKLFPFTYRLSKICLSSIQFVAQKVSHHLLFNCVLMIILLISIIFCPNNLTEGAGIPYKPCGFPHALMAKH